MSYDPVIADLNRYLADIDRDDAIAAEFDRQLDRCKSPADVAEFMAEVLLCGIGGSLNNKAARANESVRDELATYATEVWYSRNLEAVANWYERQRENAA